MKVLTAMYTMKRGGAYDRFLMMIEAFLERKWEVHCLSLTPVRIKNSFFHNHVMYFPFRKVDGFMAKLVVLFIFPFWSVWIGWRNRIDLIIAFGSLYAFIQCFSRWFLRKTMVTLIRGSLAFGSKMQNSIKYLPYIITSIENIGLRFSDRIITNNMSARDEISRRSGKKKKIDVQVLYNNIPPMNIREPNDVCRTRNKYGIHGDAKVLITSGIINQGKNLDVLIKCLPKIELEKIHLIIIGDGSTKTDFSYKDYLMSLVRELKIDHQVSFTGWLEKEDLWKIYHASDLFIMPSLNEGIPNAMLEALGAGLPCIGSAIPGIKDILQYDELLFDLSNDGALAQKIRHLFSDHQYLQEIRGLCEDRKKIFIFDWKEKVFHALTQGISSAIN